MTDEDRVGRGGGGAGGSKLIATIGIILAMIPLALVVVADLDLESQAIFAGVCLLLLFILSRFEGRGITLVLVILSITVSSRYIWWRFTDTLVFETWIEAVLGAGLLAAEMYAWIVLILGYLQTAWPLERKPEPLPEDTSLWPTVDLYVPTYNEPLALVRITVLGAMSIDYPSDKLRVWLLDDGRREEFRQFAEEAGCGYITRDNNAHAKAGNLNNALKHTDGELIAIFDSDHVPTRAFLQMTVGWFLRDRKLAVVQTPHHFYSPDPFERNLASGYSIPNEGQLFYGLIQEGNDFWNAAFFCGSCAVIRREALEAIGGFAVETVTEDAHTALKMHRAGFTSAYLRLPMAAGLATERLALHMGQRMRWARGMTQIFRLDNPLLGRGLKLPQRLCYLNAMFHFFFALPRFVFLTAPLAYLLFKQNIIGASALGVLAYAGPHLVHAVVTNSRIVSKYRHSFWGEIYESVLTFYLLKPTLVTLFNPRRGSFNVTEKGGLLPDSYFDTRVVRPQLILIALLTFASVIGLLRYIFENLSDSEMQVLALNMAWALFNLLTLGAAVAVAREARQVRSNVRLKVRLPGVIYLPDGRTVMSTSEDISMGGAFFRVRNPNGFGPDDRVDVELPAGRESVVVPARVVSWEGEDLRLMFELETIADQRRLVRAIFGRADAWLDWDGHSADRPLRAARSIVTTILGAFYGRRVRPVARQEGRRRPDQAAASRSNSFFKRRRRGSAPAMLAVAGIVGSLAFGWASGADAQSQRPEPYGSPTGQAAQRQMPPTTSAPMPAPRPGTVERQGYQPTPAQLANERANSPVALDGSEGVPGHNGVPGQPRPSATQPERNARGFANGRTEAGPAGAPSIYLPDPAVGRALTTSTATATDLVRLPVPDTAGARSDTITLRDLGEQAPILLRGVDDDAGRKFAVRRDEVVTAAQVNLNMAYSPALIPELSHLHVFVNQELIGSIQLVKEMSESRTVQLPANPVLFREDNEILFKFVGHYTLGCEDPYHSTLWGRVSDTTSIEMVKERLPLRPDLSLLPLPFFDRRDINPLALPFVLPAGASQTMLQAAGSVAGYFGDLASYRGAKFPVSFGDVPNSNAVIFATADARPSGLTLPQVQGPTLAIVANPYNELSRLLLVMGRNDDELQAAARTLALGAAGLSGPTAVVGMPQMPVRQPFDAPAWVPTNRPVRMGELIAEPTELMGRGVFPGLLTVNFQTAPGFFAWREAGIPLRVKYRYPSAQWINWRDSRLDVLINDYYLKSLPLEENRTLETIRDAVTGMNFTVNEGLVNIPPYLISGQNQLQYFFDLKPYIPGYCEGQPPENILTAIDPDTTIDFSNTIRYAPLPNLSFFVNSGYPFTRMADLSETAVVMPPRPAAAEIEAYLNLMGLMGDATGYPGTRHVVVGPGQVDQVADRDLLVIGTYEDQPLLAEWSKDSPFQVDQGRLRVRLAATSSRFEAIVGGSPQGEQERRLADELLTSSGEDMANLVSFESPLNDGRTVVAAAAQSPAGLVRLTTAVKSPDLAPSVQGDLVVLKGNEITSFRVGEQYTRETEDLPITTKVKWYFADKPLLLVALLALGVILIAWLLFSLLKKLASMRVRRRSA